MMVYEPIKRETIQQRKVVSCLGAASENNIDKICVDSNIMANFKAQSYLGSCLKGRLCKNWLKSFSKLFVIQFAITQCPLFTRLFIMLQQDSQAIDFVVFDGNFQFKRL